MNVLVILMKLIQVGAALAPVIEDLRGRDSSEFEKVGRLINAVLDAIGRGREGVAYLQNLGAELEKLHAEGRTISQVDIDTELAGILSVAQEIEKERKKLDPPAPTG